jgi:hypothetical protein
MKVLYYEDLANHIGPESCGGYGNIAAEALTGESVGVLADIELRNHCFSGAYPRPCACMGKATSTTALLRVVVGPGGV